MNKLRIVLLTLLMCLISLETRESTRPADAFVFKGYRVDFNTTFKMLMEHEGYYANHKDDRGKETYAGITRMYNSNWYGWRYIDKYKKSNKLKMYARIPECDTHVLGYYLDVWVKEHFYELIDQEVANYVFDFRINGTVGAKLTQRVLNELGCNVPINNKIDSTTIAAINSIERGKFLNALSNRRTTFYTNIVKRDSSQRIFLKHWLKRSQLNKINYEKKSEDS